MLQQALNPEATPQVTRFGWTYAPGDKVLQTVNNYEKDVYNGDIGQVAAVDAEEGQVEIDFEGRRVTYDVGELDEVALAYAATVHKSQGSEYPVVVIPLATQHYPMLARNLLYTGVTRGKHLVVVIGQPRALAIAVRNVRATQRLTNLAARLQLGGVAGAGHDAPSDTVALCLRREYLSESPRGRRSFRCAWVTRAGGKCRHGCNDGASGCG